MCSSHPTHDAGHCKQISSPDGRLHHIEGQCGLEFGMFSYHEHPGDGWELVDTALELNERHAEFISFYNAHGGIPAIKNFVSKNCCWTLRSGKRLFIDGGYALPSQQGKYSCSPKNGYSGVFKFWNNRSERSTLPAHTTKFSEGAACIDGANPGLYYRGTIMPPPSTPLKFGMFSYHEHPGDGWELVDTALELSNRRADFISFYNAHGGIPAIKNFVSKNCCWTLRSGKRLFIDGGYALPSQQGKYSCSPKNGYSGVFKFWNNRAVRWTLPASTQFTEGAACIDGGNPALYYKKA